MIFKKITDTCKPPFNQPILLLESRNKVNTVSTGHLTSIDAKGFNFSTSNMGDIFGIFGSNLNPFKPTHWCEIIIELEDSCQ